MEETKTTEVVAETKADSKPETTTTTTKVEKKGGNKALWIILAIVGLLVICCLGALAIWYFFFRTAADTITNFANEFPYTLTTTGGSDSTTGGNNNSTTGGNDNSTTGGLGDLFGGLQAEGRFSVDVVSVEQDGNDAVITLDVRNNGSDSTTFSTILFLSLVDEDGNTLSQDFFYPIDEALRLDREIGAGETFRGKIAFYVEGNPSRLTLEVRDSLFDENPLKIEL